MGFAVNSTRITGEHHLHAGGPLRVRARHERAAQRERRPSEERLGLVAAAGPVYALRRRGRLPPRSPLTRPHPRVLIDGRQRVQTRRRRRLRRGRHRGCHQQQLLQGQHLRVGRNPTLQEMPVVQHF